LADAVITRLNALAALSAAEVALVNAAASQGQSHPAGVELGGDGAQPPRPRLLLYGWACRRRELPDGRRQIFGFVLAGDVIWSGSRPRPLALAPTVTLTAAITADARSLEPALATASPGREALAAAMEIGSALEDAFLLDHLVRVGRQTAYERTGNLLLELHWRLALAGQTHGHRFALPLTQETLADALGLSVVHMNRTLQQLRRDRLIRLQSGEVELLDPVALARISDFTPPRLGPTATAGAIRPAPAELR
jgi:CRP-like cAMP-binding protein